MTYIPFSIHEEIGLLRLLHLNGYILQRIQMGLGDLPRNVNRDVGTEGEGEGDGEGDGEDGGGRGWA